MSKHDPKIKKKDYRGGFTSNNLVNLFLAL